MWAVRRGARPTTSSSSSPRASSRARPSRTRSPGLSRRSSASARITPSSRRKHREGIHRIGLVLKGHPEQRFAGLGARHGSARRPGRPQIQLGADRAYTGPDCPPDMLDIGGIPQGDYAPVPWLITSRGWAAWIETDGHGVRLDLGDEVALRARGGRAAEGPPLHAAHARRPAARVPPPDGAAEGAPGWAYGHWKSRDVYLHQRDVEDDFVGYRGNDIPLDAIVLDSPWETQYNTWEFNPHQFPDARGLIRQLRRTASAPSSGSRRG